MSRMPYRADIDGLRAVAVISVCLFHLDISSLLGGFVGVDVFFVISGFLITSIIRNNLEAGRFTFGGFYLGRVRRIMPPLIATVAVTVLASAFILLPDDMSRFARSAVGTLASLSNVIFYFEAGYWDTSSELKPLLHTWSLGVEEQFYLLWPALVVLTMRFMGRQHFTSALGVVTIVSFLGTMAWSAADPSAAFYMFPARIFQFAAGAWLGCAVRDLSTDERPMPGWVRDGVFLAGFIGVIACVLAFDEHTVFSVWVAVPPTLAALLLLLAGSFAGGPGPLGKIVLCNPLSIWFGRISYALYLVHWPIVSLYRYSTGLELTWGERAILGLAMVIAGAALHYGLERRYYVRNTGEKDRKRLSPSNFALRTGLASLVLAAVAGSAWYSQGWTWRYSDLHYTPEQIDAGMRERFSRLSEGCRINQFYALAGVCNEPDAIRVLVLGNSHEPDGFNFVLGGYGDDPNLEIVYFGTINRCPDLAQSESGQWRSSDADCQARLDVFNRQDFAESLDYLVYAANQPFSANKQALFAMVQSSLTRNPDLRVVTIGGYINTTIPCSRIVNETGGTAACAAPEYVSYFASQPEQEPLFAAFASLTDVFVDRVELLCGDRRLENCLTEAHSGEPVFYDNHHLSRGFAEMTGQLYAVRHPDLFSNAGLGSTAIAAHTEMSSAVRFDPVYSLASDDQGLRSMPTVFAVSTDAGWLLERQLAAVETTGGRTGVAHVEIAGELEQHFAGKTVRVEVAGVAPTATQLRLQYSTNEVGNSGWQVFDVEAGDFVVQFNYFVPMLRNGRGDFVGIDPVDAAILITDIRIVATDGSALQD